MPILNKLKTVSKLAYHRPRGWKSLIYNTAMHEMKKAGPLMAPVHISIEPTNACNARCPVCETGKGDMQRAKGFLDTDVFKNFIDEVAPTTNSMMYYFMGEPFIKADAYEQIRYARSKGIYVDSCTNGDFIDPVGVIYSDINKLSFQIGGMDDELHQRYRVRSSLPKITKNIESLVEERKKHPSSNVTIDVGFIVMRHNEHQVDDFIRWAQDIGVDTANVIDPCVRNMIEAHAYLPEDRRYWYYDESAFKKGILRPKVLPNNQCAWIWNSIQLNWNGDAVPCCRDPNGKHILGNVFEDGLLGVFNNPKSREFRSKVATQQGDIDICKLCSGYGLPTLNQKSSGSFSVKRHSVTDVEGFDFGADVK